MESVSGAFAQRQTHGMQNEDNERMTFPKPPVIIAMNSLSEALAAAQVADNALQQTVYVYGDPRGLTSTQGRRPGLPQRGTTHAAAYDVQAFLPDPLANQMSIEPLTTVKVPTGLHFALPPNAAMLICSRSGLASKGLMVANGPGILDSDYRGELLVLLTYVAHPNDPPYVIKHGDRIAQLMFLPPDSVLYPTFASRSLQSELPPSNSTRIDGTAGGFGSTGR